MSRICISDSSPNESSKCGLKNNDLTSRSLSCIPYKKDDVGNRNELDVGALIALDAFRYRQPITAESTTVGHARRVLSLAPVEEQVIETIDFGVTAQSCRYSRIVSLAESQVSRLSSKGYVTDDPGYEADDFVITAETADEHDEVEQLQLGTPCWVTHAKDSSQCNELGAFLGGADMVGHVRLWSVVGGYAFTVARQNIFPVPTRKPSQGEWVLATAVEEEHLYLIGRPGICGLFRRLCGASAAKMNFGKKPCDACWVMFDALEPGEPCDVVLLPIRCLATLEDFGPVTPEEGQVAKSMDCNRITNESPEKQLKTASVNDSSQNRNPKGVTNTPSSLMICGENLDTDFALSPNPVPSACEPVTGDANPAVKNPLPKIWCQLRERAPLYRPSHPTLPCILVDSAPRLHGRPSLGPSGPSNEGVTSPREDRTQKHGEPVHAKQVKGPIPRRDASAERASIAEGSAVLSETESSSDESVALEVPSVKKRRSQKQSIERFLCQQVQADIRYASIHCRRECGKQGPGCSPYKLGQPEIPRTPFRLNGKQHPARSFRCGSARLACGKQGPGCSHYKLGQPEIPRTPVRLNGKQHPSRSFRCGSAPLADEVRLTRSRCRRTRCKTRPPEWETFTVVAKTDELDTNSQIVEQTCAFAVGIVVEVQTRRSRRQQFSLFGVVQGESLSESEHVEILPLNGSGCLSSINRSVDCLRNCTRNDLENASICDYCRRPVKTGPSIFCWGFGRHCMGAVHNYCARSKELIWQCGRCQGRQLDELHIKISSGEKCSSLVPAEKQGGCSKIRSSEERKPNKHKKRRIS